MQKFWVVKIPATKTAAVWADYMKTESLLNEVAAHFLASSIHKILSYNIQNISIS